MKSVCGEDIDRYKVPEKYMDIIRFYRDFCLFEYIQKLQQFRDDLFGVIDEEEESGVGNNWANVKKAVKCKNLLRR